MGFGRGSGTGGGSGGGAGGGAGGGTGLGGGRGADAGEGIAAGCGVACCCLCCFWAFGVPLLFVGVTLVVIGSGIVKTIGIVLLALAGAMVVAAVVLTILTCVCGSKLQTTRANQTQPAVTGTTVVAGGATTVMVSNQSAGYQPPPGQVNPYANQGTGGYPADGQYAPYQPSTNPYAPTEARDPGYAPGYGPHGQQQPAPQPGYAAYEAGPYNQQTPTDANLYLTDGQAEKY